MASIAFTLGKETLSFELGRKITKEDLYGKLRKLVVKGEQVLERGNLAQDGRPAPPRSPMRKPTRKSSRAMFTAMARTPSANLSSPSPAGIQPCPVYSSTLIFRRIGRNPSRFPPNTPTPRSAPNRYSRQVAPKMQNRLGKTTKKI
jgi:hypothetical protein